MPDKDAEIAAPEPVVRAVERVLDEGSAWIARPNHQVTERVALAATLAVHAHLNWPETSYWRKAKERPEPGRKLIALYDDGSGAVML